MGAWLPKEVITRGVDLMCLTPQDGLAEEV